MMMDRLVSFYSRFVIRHPYLVLAAVVLVSIAAAVLAGTIQTEESDDQDMLPQDIEAIRTITFIEDEFGSTNDVFIAVEVDPLYEGSNEVRDVRDPRVLRYLDQLTVLSMHTDDVLEVASPVPMLKSMNNGRLPQSIKEVVELTDKNGLLTGYFSSDYSLALIKIRSTDDVDLYQLEADLNQLLTQTPAPPGVAAQLGGAAMEGVVVEKSIPEDMSRTTTFSLAGILIIILLLFRSVKFGFTPLSTIVLGSMWAMGFVGLIGMGLTAQTSGVLSMIMGIGIDFGIQVVTRYRLEVQNLSPQDAMELTLKRVTVPMATTTLAALIGFRAMSLGKLTFLADMGTIMSYGVAACMLAAVTAVPALIIIFDTVNFKIIFKKLIWRFEHELEI